MTKLRTIVKRIPVKSDIFTFIKNITFSSYPSLKPTPLGRWKTDYKSINIDRKIELANEDHCGVCDEYISKKRN